MNISDQYGAFIEASQTATSVSLPLVRKDKHFKHANHSTIVLARKEVNDLTRKYNVSKSKAIRKHLQDAKNALHNEYTHLEEDILKQQIVESESAFEANNTAKAWKIVNTITNRKSSPSGKLKGKSPDERTQLWFGHLKKLLGTPDDRPPTDEIELVLNDINIADS